MDVTFLLLHTNDIRWVIWFILIYLRVLVEREEAKLEEVLDDDCDLEGKKWLSVKPSAVFHYVKVVL